MKNTQLMYPEVINKDALLKLIKKKVMCFVNLEEGDCDKIHKYFIYDNELYEHKELTKEEYVVLSMLKEEE